VPNPFSFRDRRTKKHRPINNVAKKSAVPETPEEQGNVAGLHGLDETFVKDDETFVKDDDTFAKDDETFANVDKTFANVDDTFAKDDETFANVDEIPFDFDRRRMSEAAEEAGQTRRITKGAVEETPAVCTSAGVAGETQGNAERKSSGASRVARDPRRVTRDAFLASNL